ncbi:hypothetical protein [Rhodopila globiformis]|uniref:hypothetical protein n=1 Tax=Rhodopila globiformis TaxID=1071 RepID=UPI00130505DD|nr:hypothetical protein [Rhodopila globiformis]
MSDRHDTDVHPGALAALLPAAPTSWAIYTLLSPEDLTGALEYAARQGDHLILRGA